MNCHALGSHATGWSAFASSSTGSANICNQRVHPSPARTAKPSSHLELTALNMPPSLREKPQAGRRHIGTSHRTKGPHHGSGIGGKVAIVTGGSRGVGKAIALELAREGVDVVICGRSRDTLEASAKELAGATGRRIVAVPADTTNREAVEQMVKETVANLGRVDILVNNASTPGGLVQGPLAEASDELLMEDVNTKVIGYFRCAKAVEPHMRQQGWGRIINIGGSVGAAIGQHQWPAQCRHCPSHQDALRSARPPRH